MIKLKHEGNTLYLGNKAVRTAFPILDAVALPDSAIVLLDPDSYLSDDSYKERLRAGTDSIRNLIRISSGRNVVWEAEFPERIDYYYRIVSIHPLRVDSFSSFRSELDLATGRIKVKDFLK